VHFGVRRPPMASMRSAPGSATQTGQTSTPPTWLQSSLAKSCCNERRRRGGHRSRRDVAAPGLSPSHSALSGSVQAGLFLRKKPPGASGFAYIDSVSGVDRAFMKES
jgi:hypothetical protein